MHIVFLDADSIGNDIDYDRFKDFGTVKKYGYSKEEKIEERIKDADIIIVNKLPINEKTVGEAKKLKLVCVSATGTNNLDKEFLEKRGIEWRNVAGYSTENVAQHTFALLFYLLEKMPYYDNYVKSEKYVNDSMFTHFENVYHELSGQTWGIIGLGNIGKRVGDIAKCFGCRVIYYSTSKKHDEKGYERVELDTLLKESDIVSVHAPLNEDTKGLMNAESFSKMKSTAIFINVGRGPIVCEKALYDALTKGEIAAAGLDVLEEEPMTFDNPLRALKDSEKLVITPHIAWASIEARRRLMSIIYDQIKEYVSKGM